MSDPTRPDAPAAAAGEGGALAPRLPDPDATVRAAGELFALERQQVEVRREQLALSRLEGERAHEYALRLLDAQVQDRQDQRRHEAGNGRIGLAFVLVLIVAFVGLAAYALHLNKDALVLDVVKVLAGVLGGGGIGYAIGARKRDGTGGGPASGGDA